MIYFQEFLIRPYNKKRAWKTGSFKFESVGAESGTRTRDLLITNELLYQLSYFGNVFRWKRLQNYCFLETCQIKKRFFSEKLHFSSLYNPFSPHHRGIWHIITWCIRRNGRTASCAKEPPGTAEKRSKKKKVKYFCKNFRQTSFLLNRNHYLCTPNYGVTKEFDVLLFYT